MLIKLADYQRIYHTIQALLLQDRVAANEVSMLFSVYGAQILKQHYGLNAQPVAGAMAIHLGPAKIFSYGQLQDKQLKATSEHHQWWIEVDGWLIDFTAPLLPLLYKRTGNTEANVPFKMLQKPLADCHAQWQSLSEEGAVWKAEDDDLTVAGLQRLASNPGHIARGQVAMKWYVKPPKKQPNPMTATLSNGQRATYTLGSQTLSGAW